MWWLRGALPSGLLRRPTAEQTRSPMAPGGRVPGVGGAYAGDEERSAARLPAAQRRGGTAVRRPDLHKLTIYNNTIEK